MLIICSSPYLTKIPLSLYITKDIPLTTPQLCLILKANEEVIAMPTNEKEITKTSLG
jgi:hypothetical protein